MTTTENYNGGSCTGQDGEANRTLTIANTSVTDDDSFQVFVNSSFLHNITDYTVNHKTAATVITFLNALWNVQTITVIYSVTSTTTATTTTEQSTLSTGETGILPLDTQLINNELNYFGDTITLRKVTKLDYDKRGNAQEVLGDSKISYLIGDDALEDFYDSTWIAQTFVTSTSDIELINVKIKVKRTGTPGKITIGIRAVDTNNKPTGSDLTSGSLDYTELLDDGDTEWISIPLTEYTLSSSTIYAIIISSSGGDSSNKYEARNVATGAYSGGSIFTSSDSGGAWTAGSSDVLFDIYGDTNTVAVTNIMTFEDESVKAGVARLGDIRLFFQNTEDVNRGDKIKFRDVWYKIDSLFEESFGDVNYTTECICKKI